MPSSVPKAPPIKKQSGFKSIIRSKIGRGIYGSKLTNDMYSTTNNPFRQKYGDYHRLKSAYNRVLSPYKRHPFQLKIGKRYKLV